MRSMYALAAFVMAPIRQTSLEEFLRDPTLTVACVLLIVVSFAWIVVSRIMVRRIKHRSRAAAQRR
ncbi:MAG: hypothetical protein H0W21_06435 [Actinobacteria bacterium]|nr:hypothetical protein [Actinomycetota bacterium]